MNNYIIIYVCNSYAVYMHLSYLFIYVAAADYSYVLEGNTCVWVCANHEQVYFVNMSK